MTIHKRSAVKMVANFATFSILEPDVRDGVINSSTADPLAIAAQRAGLECVSHGPWNIRFRHHGVWYRGTLDAGTRQLLKRLHYVDRFEAFKWDKKGEQILPWQVRVVGCEVLGPHAVEDGLHSDRLMS